MTFVTLNLNQDALEVLPVNTQIGKNPIKHEGALALLSAINKNFDSTAMYTLDLSGVIVEEDFDDLEKDMQARRGLEIIHGGVLYRAKHVIVPEFEDLEAKFELDPMSKMKKYVQVNKLRLVDLFRQIDKGGTMTVNYEQFKRGIQVDQRRAMVLNC